MKNILTTLYLLALTLVCKAHDIESNGLYYRITDGEELTLELVASAEGYATTSVVVPMRVDYDGRIWLVTAIGDKAFANCTSLSSITLPPSLFHIGESAFFRCSSLKEIVFPEHLMSVGNWAFAGCSALQQIEFPVTAQYLGKGCVANCHTLQKAVVRSKMRELPENMFHSCWLLTDVELPELLTIGQACFEDCRSLNSIQLPATLRTIGGSAFSGCKMLSQILLPDHLTTIGRQAFWGCQSLTDVQVPASVSTVGFAAFADCTSLKNAYLPSTLKHLEGWAFNRCTSLRECAIPASQTALEPAIFCKCKQLQNIVIPDGVRNTGYGVFADCSNARSITFGNGLKNIGDETFFNLDAVKTINIPENVDSIGRDAFENCSALEQLTIPSRVNVIALNAFRDCLALREVYSLMESPCELPELGFADATFNSATLYVPAGFESIYKNKNFWKKFVNILPFDFSRIPTVSDTRFSIRINDKDIHVGNTPSGAIITLFNANGHIIASHTGTVTDTVFTVATRGVYIVMVDNQRMKIII